MEQRAPVAACTLHHPAEEAGRETKETWGSGRRPGRRAQSRFGPVFTASILRSSVGADLMKSCWCCWDFPSVADWWRFPWLNGGKWGLDLFARQTHGEARVGFRFLTQ